MMGGGECGSERTDGIRCEQLTEAPKVRTIIVILSFLTLVTNASHETGIARYGAGLKYRAVKTVIDDRDDPILSL